MADIRLTPEQARAMRGLAPFSKDAVSKFTPKCFNKEVFPEEYRPIFHLKALTRKAKKEMVNKGLALQKDDSSVDLEDMKELIRPFIVNIERLYDIGSETFVEYATDPDGYISKDLFHSIPSTVINEITSELTIISGLKAQESLGLE